MAQLEYWLKMLERGLKGEKTQLDEIKAEHENRVFNGRHWVDKTGRTAVKEVRSGYRGAIRSQVVTGRVGPSVEYKWSGSNLVETRVGPSSDARLVAYQQEVDRLRVALSAAQEMQGLEDNRPTKVAAPDVELGVRKPRKFREEQE